MPRRKKIATKPDLVKSIKKNEKMPSRLLGMKDFTHLEQACFDLIYQKAFKLADTYGFQAIKTPSLESLDLYKKSSRRGDDKDIYSVDGDKGEKAVLRPELTQGIIRSYIENNPELENKAARLFSYGSVFRKEKLQSGCYRESTQFNMEVIGARKPMVEASLIYIASRLLTSLDIDFQIQINSLGDAACRKEYCLKLTNFYKEGGKKSKLCSACKLSLTKNCLSLLDCKNDACIKLREEAPQIADCLSLESRDFFTKTLEILDELKIPYNFNPYLVRGFNYYNDVVFEIWSINKDGSLNNQALAGGGRYDNLVENLGGPSLPSAGLALGIERIISKIKDKATLTKKQEKDIVFIAQLSDPAKLKSMLLAEELLAAGFNIKQSLVTDSLKEQLEDAAKMEAKLCLILGKKEIMDGTILMREVDSGAQETVVFKKIKERLTKKMSSF